tara:strand:+ start:1105 stop:1689 length:585 start_codon:yes stop_codon:yes gene_type:complete
MIDDELKNEDVIIYDDFFLKEDFKLFEKEIVENGNFPWYLISNKTVHNDHNIIKNNKVIEYLQLNHILKQEYEKDSNSSYYRLLEEKIPYILNKLGLKNIEIIRAKLNLQTQFTNNKPYLHNTPHRDANYIHNVLILYLNDSDGDTIIFDDNSKIKKRITPKKNRVVIFKGINYHAGCNPYKSKKRIVLNINFK